MRPRDRDQPVEERDLRQRPAADLRRSGRTAPRSRRTRSPVIEELPGRLHDERRAVLQLRAQRDRGVAAVQSRQSHSCSAALHDDAAHAARQQPAAERRTQRDASSRHLVPQRPARDGTGAGMWPVKTRNGRSTSPANGSACTIGCAQSGNSGSGTIMPERNVTSAVSRITAPSPLIVQSRLMLISVVRAQPSSSVHTSVAANAMRRRERGRRRRGATRRDRSAAGRAPRIRHIGTARSTVGAVRHASARAYHRPYRSTGRHSS